MLQAFIAKKLKDTKKHCKYKCAHEPRGWTSVNIIQFSRELARELEHEIKSRRFK